MDFKTPLADWKTYEKLSTTTPLNMSTKMNWVKKVNRARSGVWCALTMLSNFQAMNDVNVQAVLPQSVWKIPSPCNAGMK